MVLILEDGRSVGEVGVVSVVLGLVEKFAFF